MHSAEKTLLLNKNQSRWNNQFNRKLVAITLTLVEKMHENCTFILVTIHDFNFMCIFEKV